MGVMEKLLVPAVVFVLAWAGVRADAGDLAAWAADPHVKVFRDAKPPAKAGAVAMRSARNEYEPAQIAIRSAEPLKGVRVQVGALRRADGKAAIPPERITWNFVGFIPVKKNTRGSERIRVRAAPCDVPDPLLADRTLDLAAETTQPVWLTVHVPADAAPGVYRGQVAVAAGGERATLPVELTVDPFTLPEGAQPHELDVLDNDDEPDGQALTITAVEQGSESGTVVITNNGSTVSIT